MTNLKIAAICALPKPNPGMLSVDAAVSAVLSRHAINASVTFYSMSGGKIESAGQSRFQTRTYTKLESNTSFEDFDIVLIWGDFLHSRKFLKDVARHVLREDPLRSEKDVESTIFKHLLMEGATDGLLSKVVCFGGSLYINGPKDDWDERYRSAIGRLYSQARLVLTRDPVSAAYAQMYGARGQTLGVDASFLLGQSTEIVPEKKTQIGYSFGRGVRRSRMALLRSRHFVESMRRSANAEKLTDIDWLGGSDFAGMDDLYNKIEQIRRCSFIITDTYHCAINSWREGVPAFCIGFGTEHAENPLSEKKKELLYSIFNARNYYVYAEILGFSKNFSIARALLAMHNNANVSPLISRNIEVATLNAEQALMAAIKAG